MSRLVLQMLCALPVLCTTIDVRAKPRATERAGLSVLKATGRLRLPVRFRRIGSDAGLPTSAVFHIVQDKTGFIWLGTQAGLVKYDGSRMTTYEADKDDPNAILDSTVTALAAADRGGVWVGTDKGLNRFDPTTGRFIHYQHDSNHPKTLQGTTVTAIHATGDAIWVGTDEGLNKMDISSGTFELPPNLRGISVTTIFKTSDGLLLIGTQVNGLLVYDSKADQITHKYTSTALAPSPLNSDHVTAIVQDASGIIWVGTKDSGLHSLNLKAGTIEHYQHRDGDSMSIGDDHVTSLLNDPSGALWVGTEGDGLNMLDKERRLFSRAAIDTEIRSRLAFQWVLTLYRDNAGMIWVGTLAGGISTFDSLSVSLGAHSFNDTAIVMSFFEDQDGSFWVGTGPSQEGSGIYRINPNSLRYTHYKQLGKPNAPGSVDLRKYYMAVLYRDTDGVLWIGTEKAGLIAFNPDTEEFKQYPMTDNHQSDAWSSDVFSLVKQGQTVWLGTWGGGLIAFDSVRETFKQYAADEEQDGLRSNYIYRVQQDVKDQNLLWLGTADQGLTRFDIKHKTFITYNHDPNNPNSLSHNAIASIYQEPTGVLWLGTYGGGLNRFDPDTGSVKRYTKKTGFLPGTIYGVLPDENGRLWLSTDGNGLWMLNPKDDSVQRFSAEDGLQSDEFSYRSAHVGRSGRLYFGGPHGFNAFYPKDIKADSYMPPIVLTGLSLFGLRVDRGVPLSELDRLSLNYHDSVFSIEFTGLAYADPGRISYEYRLEGFRDEWMHAERGAATFTNLSHGDYTLHVRGKGRHQATNGPEASLAIHMEPPIWRTWWAYGIYIAILGGIVLSYLRYQAQRLEAVKNAHRLDSVERELQLSAAVQTGFLPRENSLLAGPFKIFGFHRAADHCSGDWWWYERGANRRTWVLVGDVTGHGAGPAMVTAAVGTAFRVGAGGTQNVMDRLNTMNDEALAVGRGQYHMVLTAFELDEITGKFVVYGAGGLPALRLTSDGKVKPIMVTGTPIGSTTDVTFGRVEGKLEVGDRMLLLTDGLAEIELQNGRLLGMKQLCKLFAGTKGMKLDEAAALIVVEADKAKGPKPQDDDWTFVLVEWSPGAVLAP